MKTTTTIVLDKSVVENITGNRSQFIREAIAEKLHNDFPSISKINAELKELKRQTKELKLLRKSLTNA